MIEPRRRGGNAMSGGTGNGQGRFLMVCHPWRLDSGVQAGMTAWLFACFQRDPGKQGSRMISRYKAMGCGY